MPQALNVVSGRVTNPGATLTALTVNAGDSFTVKSFPFGSSAYIMQAWASEATIGVFRIRSPRLHDASQAIRLRVGTTTPNPLLPFAAEQQVQPQDALTVELSGGGAETDMAAFLVYYADLPGIAARLITHAEYLQRVVNIFGSEVAMTTGGTAGQYGGAVALNASFDTFKRNVDYAWLGCITDVSVGVVGITGPDTGQTRIGMPGIADPYKTRDFWVETDDANPFATIPVINAANISATIIDLAAIQTATAVNVTVILAELSGGPGGGVI